MKHSIRRQELEEGASVLRQPVFSGKVISVVKETIQIDKMPPYEWDVVLHRGAVAVLPIHADGRVVLIQQWRRPVNKILYEVPAGLLEVGEAPIEAASREMQEEVGYAATKWTPFGGLYTAPGFCNEFIHLFIAQELSCVEMGRDIHEAIDVIELTLEQALSLIDNELIDDAKTISILLKYARLKEKNQ